MHELSRFYIKNKDTKLIDEVTIFDDCSVQFNTKTYWKHLKFKAKNLYYFLFKQEKSLKNSHNKIVSEHIVATFEVLNNYNKNHNLPIIDYQKEVLNVHQFLNKKIPTKQFKITKTKPLKYTKSKVNYIG